MNLFLSLVGNAFCQSVPSSKTIHWIVLEFTPCKGLEQASGGRYSGLTCRFGRCFCFAEVSPGDPHPCTLPAF